MDGVHRFAGDVDEGRRRWIGGLRQRIDAQQFLETLDRRFRVTLHHKPTAGEPVVERARFEYVVTLRHFPLIVRRKQQVLAALALVRPGVTEVSDVAVPEVIDEAECIRWTFDHDRPVLQIDPSRCVDTFAIARQEQRSGVHQCLGDEQRSVVWTERTDGSAHCHLRGGRNRRDERLYAALEVEVVVDLLHGRLIRETVGEA
ncbi:hypothetical protein D3C84_494100 [compost metagenome]